ncbi:MAG TPA: hypothetical protein VEO54_30685 [Thermoanaerobaculia bacterium]|nr:hypothetical protein [Thermoanaerobaculia bacterium]
MRLLAALCLLLAACADVGRASARRPPRRAEARPTLPYAVVLGIAQDGGYPQAGCTPPDCVAAWRNPQRVASLGIIDPISNERWLIDATPDFPSQLHDLGGKPPTGILLTHAHIGHYLAYLDGTFHTAGELPGRDLREIPHPLISETVARLAGSPLLGKVRFIHLNQSNPLLRERRAGIVVASDGERESL